MVSCSIEGCELGARVRGYCRNCVRKLRRRGIGVSGETRIPDIPTRAAKVTPEEKVEMVRLRSLGWTTYQIAKHVHVNQSTVSRHLP